MKRDAWDKRPVSNPTREHVDTVARLFRFTKVESEEFDVRDYTVLLRMKGRIIGLKLPGIGADFDWLDRRTDEDTGAGDYKG